MYYFAEFRTNWRPLLAATLGLSSGMSLIGYVASIFAPKLLTEFGWSRSEFALAGMIGGLVILFIPMVGRMADLFGVRRVASVGIFTFPLTFIGLSLMTGNILEYVAINIIQVILCTTTTATVYSRIVAERFVVSRGLALAILTCGPAATGAIASPVLTSIIDGHGWRAGYQVLALFFAVMGGLVLLALPRSQRKADAASKPKRRTARADYSELAKNRFFWALMGATLLCSMPHALANSQLKLMLLDSGISSAASAVMVSIFAVGVIVGRILGGLALDRYPPYLVAMIGMGLPAIGLFILGSGASAPMVIALGTLMIGLSYGAEGDIIAYLVVRHFGVSLFSTVLGLMTATMATASTLGAGLLSVTLRISDSYSPFMWIAGTSVLIGCLSFLQLKNAPVAQPMH